MYQKEKESQRNLDPKRIKWIKEWRQKKLPQIRRDVISFYSDGKNECACCGEKGFDFLSIDHIANDGFLSNKNIHDGGHGVGTTFYAYLRSRNFPMKDNLQVLCMNCNFSKKKTGVCAHKRQKPKL